MVAGRHWIEIDGRRVGDGAPCFIIAEAGVNHNGDMEIAKALVNAAKRAGADAVKFQSFHAAQLATAGAPKAEYQRQTTNGDESQLEMLRRLELSPEAHQELVAYCRDRGILFLSTPFEQESADLLEQLGVPAFKIASGELTNTPLLVHIAAKGRPMIVSTGMATLDEVDQAVETIQETGNDQIVVLHCVSRYPAAADEANVRAILTMADALELPIGYSDHTIGLEVPLAAVALGACVIEKHLTLDRSLPGPDHRASQTPEEFGVLVRAIRTVERALGHGRKEPSPAERETAAVARKSLVAARKIPAGAKLSAEMIAIMRPGTGLPPSMADEILGRSVRQEIPQGAVLTWEMLAA